LINQDHRSIDELFIKFLLNPQWPFCLSFVRFSMASPEEIRENDDDCAVCWERMETARKLPCGHLFHK